MAEMLLIESLKELQAVIDQQHLIYLELDESPKKIDQRDKLESYIKEYLCLAPHDSKFTFHQTAEVLCRSAYTKSNFSAYKAAVAWKAIGKYADNLISHPWRKEYRDIKLYCGFYKHEIEENLVGAELMFEAMGYRHIGQSSMTLPGILDPDRITSVSKDAIVAYVECQIMKQIWEALSSHINITWYEILEFRENHTGTPDQVIRALTYKYRLRLYQEQLYHRPQQIQTSCHLPQSHCVYATGCYSQNPYPGPSYSVPVQSRYGPVISPQHMLPTSPIYPTDYHPSYAAPHNIIKPQDMYPVNGYHMRQHYPPQMGLPHMSHNGCSMMPLLYPGSSIVPTGQLIELDSSPTNNGGEPYSQKFSKYSPQEEQLDQQCALKDDVPSLSGRAKDDGAGAWENWDYVYRNLESHGYKKDTEPGCELNSKENLGSSSQNNSSDVEVDGMIQSDFSDKFRKLKLESNSQSKGETNSSKNGATEEESSVKNTKEKIKPESEKPREKVRVEVKSSKTSPEKTKKSSGTVSSKTGTNKKKENEVVSKENSKSRKLKEDIKPLIVNMDEPEEKWQCVTCTYLNSVSNNVCEMCYKSKDRGSELNPQPSGGQECPQCTLVNEPGLSNCAACNASLKDSPTYI